ncbi:unnamed protein product [Ambrosiozyma monospora]|uniref:Unnamed protein product n=1 Tax=Ambrosiozyma monospora TaxID=43982 RepID=A0ACB5SZ78_AMBMO|nr:unnamed protein product [Ambrosiozyma monospora]
MGIKQLLAPTPLEDVVGRALAPIIARDTVPWYKKRHLVLLNILLISPLLSSAAGGFDGSLMNGLQSLTTWKDEYDNPRGELLGFVNAALSFGCLMGAFVAGWSSDRWGRRTCLIAGSIGIIVCTVIQATAKGLPQLIVSRWLLGFASMFSGLPSPLLVTELAYPSHRGKLTALYNTFYYLGAILSSWACYGVSKRLDKWGYMAPTLLQMAYPAIQLSLVWWLPESPRWYVSKDRYAEAKAVLTKFHAGGDESSELVNVEISEIVEAIEMEKQSKSTSWSELLKTPGNRKRTYIAVSFAIFAQWCGNAVISYYFTLVLDTIGYTSSDTQTLINGLLQLFNFGAAIFAAMMVDKLGRKVLLMWSSTGMLISYIIWTVMSQRFEVTQSKVYGQLVLAFIFIYFFHYDVAFTPLLISYCSEIFPYYLRSKGISIVNFVTQCALVIAQFCNSIAMDQLGWKYYIVFCVLDAVIVINIFFFYPETKGYSLEEIAEIFDGPNAAVDIEQANPELKHKVSHDEYSAEEST